MMADIKNDDETVFDERYRHAYIHIDTDLIFPCSLDSFRTQRWVPRVLPENPDLFIDLIPFPNIQLLIVPYEISLDLKPKAQ